MRAYLALAISLLTAAPVFSQSRSADEAALRKLLTTYETARNERNAAGVAAVFTTDGDWIIQDAPLMTGRAAMTAGLEEFNNAAPTRRVSLAVTGIRFVGSDTAIVETISRFTEGEIRGENRGTFVAARQRGGDWLFAAFRALPAERR